MTLFNMDVQGTQARQSAAIIILVSSSLLAFSPGARALCPFDPPGQHGVLVKKSFIKRRFDLFSMQKAALLRGGRLMGIETNKNK